MKEYIGMKEKKESKSQQGNFSKTEEIFCPICNSNKNRILFSAKDRAYDLPGYFPVRKCNQCNLVYLSPRPTNDVLHLYYPRGEYFHIGKNISTENVDTSKKVTRLGHFVRVLKQVGYNYQNGYRGIILKITRIFYFIFQKYLLRLPHFRVPKYIVGGKLLEIGFGEGKALKRFRLDGWNIAGADIDKDCCEYAKRVLKVAVLEMNGSNINTSDNSFDVIYLSQTFEHLPDPIASLNEYYRVLKEDGQLIMEFPNFACKQAKRWKSEWRGLEVPRHLFFYTPKTALMMLEKVGYHDIQVMPVCISHYDLFLGSVPPTIKNNLANKNSWWNNRIIKTLVQLAGPSFGYGESLYVRARKKNGYS